MRRSSSCQLSRSNKCREDISLSVLQSKFHLPISKAAKELGMGVTVLKKYCRKFHIHRWPFRKLNSMSKLIGSVEGTTAGAGQVRVG